MGIVAVLAVARAWAECPITLVPADAPKGWSSAVESARSRLASASSHDCGSVEVAVRPNGGAVLTFTTTDGRRAVRTLMSPEELVPALDALLVTLPPEAAPASSAAPSSSAMPSASVPAPAAPPSSSSAPVVAAPPEVHFAVGLSAGARLGLAGAYATPAFGLRPSGSFGAWELGGAIEYDPSYAYLPGAPPGFTLWSFIANLQVGRREVFQNIAIGYGLGLGVASIRETVDDTDGLRKILDFGQPRASAYFRVVWPPRSTFRATFEIGFDAALTNLKRKVTVRNDVPDLPRWGIVSSVGLETSAL
ncbi:MAG: hypothetical protein ACXWP4_27450 [Polyangiales bacterium]